MSLINLDNIDYKGYDVAKNVIDYNITKFKKPNVNFYLEKLGTKPKYIAADLLICKDVLQHLNFQEINNIISEFHKFKYIIMINDIENTSNKDIKNGGYRSLNIEKAPFNIKNITQKYKFWDTEKNKTLFLMESKN